MRYVAHKGRVVTTFEAGARESRAFAASCNVLQELGTLASVVEHADHWSQLPFFKSLAL